MQIAKLQVIAVVQVLFVLAGSAVGQHSFTNTVTVDPSGSADQTTIQGGIDALGTPGVRGTVLIYAGVYTLTTPVTLDGDDENIDLVGIDRESVIINVSGTGQQSGIVITSGTETSRNNRIANLTIITSNGHGIEIVKGGTPVPKNITIEGVTIHADGSGAIGIYASEVEKLRITNVDITTTNGHGIELVRPKEGIAPKDIVIQLASIKVGGSGKNAIHGATAQDVRIVGSYFETLDGEPVSPGHNWVMASTFMRIGRDSPTIEVILSSKTAPQSHAKSKVSGS